MDEAEFWTLIEGSREGAGEVLADQTAQLVTLLRRLTPNKIVLFHRHLVAANHALYTWPMADAALLVFGSSSDDAFADFRSWVVSLGEEAYRHAMSSPDTLADAPWPDVEILTDAEEFTNVAAEAYEASTGRDIHEDNPGLPLPEMPPGSPAGERHDADDLAAHYPRLAARHRSK